VISLLNDLWDLILDLPGIIVGLFKDLFIFLFVPEDNYFNNMAEEFRTAINEKIPYYDYLDTIEEMKNINVDNITENIDLNNYYISDNLSINKDKWIDFSIFDKYKTTWFTWSRVVIYIMLIFYNINQIIVLFRGAGAVNGYVSTFNNNDSKATSNK